MSNPVLSLKNPAFLCATWFGCGLARKAPGTWGTLGALPAGYFLSAMGFVPLLIGFIVVCGIGVWSIRKIYTHNAPKDAGYIVIDEVAGMWLVLLLVDINTLIGLVLAFLLFRAFDIIKPWPVSWADRTVPGAVGVMLDDLLAAIYAGLCLLGLEYAGLNL
jgi:phosphatidylglycerophosphatase A